MTETKLDDGTIIEHMEETVFSAKYDPAIHGVLKACPFCGESDGLEVSNTHTPSFWVQCACSAQMDGDYEGVDYSKISFADRCQLYYRAMKSAVVCWNKRADLPVVI